MTAQEKAIELIGKYDNVDFIISYVPDSTAKQCALIAVDELIIRLTHILQAYAQEMLPIKENPCYVASMLLNEEVNYWQQVKDEIIKYQQH